MVIVDDIHLRSVILRCEGDGGSEDLAIHVAGAL